MVAATTTTNNPPKSEGEIGLAGRDKLHSDGYLVEWRACSRSPAYFIHEYCQIYDSETERWVPFRLWREQYTTLQSIAGAQLVVILKARQLGLTWLCLGFGLWLMLFRPIAEILLFSRRDDEAVYLLGRLRGMYERLPGWMQAERVAVDSAHVFGLSNGSTARAFPTTGGDGYTATYALVDEADLVADLGELLGRVQPTVDAGGKLVLLSRVDKSKPDSRFKRIYRAAAAGLNAWRAVFLPWWVRPGRDGEWYERQKMDVLENTGALDDLYEQYPATDSEALAPSTADKRIPAEWIERIAQPGRGRAHERIAGLMVWAEPIDGRRYVGGVDCAEGLPTSDESVTTWIDAETGEQVATLAGKFSPAVHAAVSAQVCRWYNGAAVMIENNNHGHAFLLWMADNGRGVKLLAGHGGKLGWSSTTLGKVLLYDNAATEAQMGTCAVRDFETMTQLQSIEAGTLRAPDGMADDRADAFALALAGRSAAREVVRHDDNQTRVRIGW